MSEPLDLGCFSVSLSVADLDKSVAFYEALGFEVLGGHDNYRILGNGPTKIGVFQGVFEVGVAVGHASNSPSLYAVLWICQSKASQPTFAHQGLSNPGLSYNYGDLPIPFERKAVACSPGTDKSRLPDDTGICQSPSSGRR